MAIRKLRPMTPGTRWYSVSTFEEITKTRPEKALLEPLKKSGGRNNTGRVTSRHRGGGHKRRYRLIDFKRDRIDEQAEVIGIEYDPNRSARIALIQYPDESKSYIIAPLGLKPGDKIISYNFKFGLGDSCTTDEHYYPEVKGIEHGFSADDVYYDFTVEDNNNYIAWAGTKAVVISNTGFNFSNLRPRGSRVSNRGVTDGPCSFIRVYDFVIGETIKQSGKSGFPPTLLQSHFRDNSRIGFLSLTFNSSKTLLK